MSANPPAKDIKQLRHLIASVISDAKAYDVPALCSRLGLADGTGDEAFSSKYKYASKRLALIDATGVITIARKLASEESDYYLDEAVAHIDELGGHSVTELTRRRIISQLDQTSLCTEIDQIDFLRKAWPIARMRSPYGRQSLEEDIFQHTIRNDDWSNKDLLEQLGFLTCSRAQLFKFFISIVDPMMQTPDRQKTLVESINEHLRHDGYRLAVVGRISGSPKYEVKEATLGAPSDSGVSAALTAFGPQDVQDRWHAAMDRRTTDPGGAITLARTLLEDVCKWILTEAEEEYADDADLPVLYRKLSKILKLAPDDHTEQVFKQILGSCQSVVESLGALRNKLGDAHSIGPRRARPLPRHAELAVTLAGGMATFLVSTWEARRNESAA